MSNLNSSRTTANPAYQPSRGLPNSQQRSHCEATRHAIAEGGVELLEMEETFGIAHLVKQYLSIPVAVQLHGPFFAKALEARLLLEPEARQRVELEDVAIAAAGGLAAPSLDILERTRAHYELPLAGAMASPRPAPVVTQERRWRLADCEAVRYCSSAVSTTVVANSRFPSTWPKTRRRSPTQPGSRLANRSRRRGKSAERVDILGLIAAVPSRYESFGKEVLEALAAQLDERAGDDASRRYYPQSLARDRAEFHREIIQREAAKRRRTT